MTSCKEKVQQENSVVTQAEATPVITEQEVLDARKGWGEGIVKIGKVYREKGDYKAAATEHINRFYNYREGIMLFKPTLLQT